ncbi:hypothetical protein [Pseudarthrobacter sp. NIBRBAC000502770]|uniref:hypothetical protein n=1 Tax=Pseudarthrobacter sp. NIBRBAC000502770 TaxID=2590785 RepID=UPI00143D4CEF|nr:hypothetical protein [Pseudarthrobacter sp. NIBRBAC000502770]
MPTFLAAPLLGDFPDIGITPFFALRYRIPYLLLFFYPVLQGRSARRLMPRRRCGKAAAKAAGIIFEIGCIAKVSVSFILSNKSRRKLRPGQENDPKFAFSTTAKI